MQIIEEMSKESLYEEIRQAHCLLHPSFVEGMPNVVLESLMLGRPCIVSDIPPHREIVEEGRSGFLFDPENPDSLARLLRQAAEAPGSLLDMADDCRARARLFSLERKIDGYEALYRTLVDERHALART